MPDAAAKLAAQNLADKTPKKITKQTVDPAKGMVKTPVEPTDDGADVQVVKPRKQRGSKRRLTTGNF